MKKTLAALALALLAFALLAQRLFRLGAPLSSFVHNNRQTVLPISPSPTAARASAPGPLPASNSGPEGELPVGLGASIAAALPGYGLPGTNEGHHPYTEMCETNSTSPFFSAGDFTGRGLQEFALILTGPEKLRFAIFSPDSQGQFQMVFLARPKTAAEWGAHWEESLIERPEQIDLCKVPKGKPWAPEGGDAFKDLRPATDAVAIHTHPQRNYDVQSLILYKNAAFQQVFLEPLVQLR